MHAFLSRYAIIGLFAFVHVASANAQSDAENENLVFLQAAYEENRQKFTTFVCRFRVAKVKAESIDALLDGKVTTRVQMRGLWCVNGSEERYSLKCVDPSQNKIPDPNSDPDARGVSVVMGQCDSVDLLGNDRLGLSFSFGLQSASLSPSRGAELPIHDTPISMGFMGDDEKFAPNRTPPPSQLGDTFKSYGGQERKQNKLTEVIVSGVGSPAEVRCADYWHLCPEYDFLPIEVEFRIRGQVSSRAVVTDVRAMDNGGYFPFRSVVFTPRTGEVHGTVIEVDELELRTPTDEEMTIKLPAGTTLANNDQRKHFYSISKETKFSPANLQEAYDQFEIKYQEKIASKIPTRKTTESGDLVPKSNRKFWFLLAGLMACLLAMIKLFVTARNKRY